MNVSPSGGGTVQVNGVAPSSYPASYDFKNGTSVRLEAVASTGYKFDGWSESLDGTTNPATMVIDCNKKVVANFSPINHTLIINVKGNGATTPSVGSHSYGKGSTVSISAVPDSGWQFDGWTGDVAEPDSATTMVTINSDKTITVNFSQVGHNWWLTGGIIAGAIIFGVVIVLAVRSRAS
ncbi:MAG: InlB B-repeat-containing protein [Dehalococcoidales bacterium]